MIKRMTHNRKGQMTQNEIVYLIIALGVLIVVFLAIFGVFGEISFLSNLSPDRLSKMATVCEQYAKNPIAGNYDYCLPREGKINGIKGWYNCDYVYDEIIKVNEVNWNKIPGACSQDVSKLKCESLKNEKGSSYRDSIIVNGQTCKSLGISE